MHHKHDPGAWPDHFYGPDRAGEEFWHVCVVDILDHAGDDGAPPSCQLQHAHGLRSAAIERALGIIGDGEGLTVIALRTLEGGANDEINDEG